MLKDFPDLYEYDQNGFIHQKKHDKFVYTVEYREHQSTNAEMSYLRLGWISFFFKYEQMMDMNVVDIGCGSGMFVSCCKGKFKRIVGYDIVGESISKEELNNTEWDLIVLSDVLEHFENINDLFKLKWKYAMVSFPETPNVESFEELTKWRHFKPNEHLWYLNLDGINRWIKAVNNGVKVIGSGNFEDLIRKRWDLNKTNISTIMLERHK